jgi:serine phosphatase RsbU (regulator of sigma subunit)
VRVQRLALALVRPAITSLASLASSTTPRAAEESEERARVLAATLQASLIPPAPRIPGLDLGAVYRPAGSGAEVGGDYYDVFEIGLDDWAIAIGDVLGKGAQAATLTALVRYTIRAAAVQVREPSLILGAAQRCDAPAASGKLLHHCLMRAFNAWVGRCE